MAAVAEHPSSPAAPAAKPPQALTFRLWRGDQSGGSYQDFPIQVDEGMVVLDVVHRIQATQANDLAVRWNCKAGKCGSCSAEVNGKPLLMCMTRMDLFEAGSTITISPIKTFPVIRDHEENKQNFAGPRLFVRLAALEMHPLDTNDRRDLLKAKAGLGYCNITKCCTEVCPEHIHITDNAIIPLKERVVTEFYDPLAWVARKLTGKDRRSGIVD